MANTSTHAIEIKKGTRYEFGKNWSAFLTVLNDQRIDEAVISLKQMLQVDSLAGKSFLDIGSGSGLFSLAAKKLGATVHSFDFDPNSVRCTRELKERYYKNDSNWQIQEASILDDALISSLPKFDIVYSWGVLHHTGQMWRAIENAIIPIKDEGTVFIALYNDQGWKSRVWLAIKKTYTRNIGGRLLVLSLFIPLFIILPFIKDLILFRNPIKSYTEYKKQRGMSKFYDFFDWWGGLPFEVASIDDIFVFFNSHKFTMVNLKTAHGSLGCNQFVFKKLK
jgi:2-polyprenyl-3-methyl-5-hydroxy-6-metoxy-1,4-benzoquinol methylase